VLFLEDDMVLDPDAISILIGTYQLLSVKDPKLGAVAPSIPRVQYADLKASTSRAWSVKPSLARRRTG
jgi:hypothetical protein